ncbi:hypothetical protein GCM10023340_37750 [Nocardioides marinquilinus]|uniref:Secreted protein n=1 Tax=Nocardioides marinquilinus TaxID=1210400 RepID=A0ABP9Q128_9ACTN
MTHRPLRRPLVALAAAVAAVVLLAGCGGDDPSEPVDPGREVLAPAPDGAQHTHLTFVGDGTTADAGGYRIADLVVPAQVGTPGRLAFRILDSRGQPVVDYVEEQTKLLHLYVVRDGDRRFDAFRHLHPVLGDDGTWSTTVDLAEPGDYRVVAEFVPAERSDGAHVVVGERARLEAAPGATYPEPQAVEAVSTASDGVVTVAGPPTIQAGVDAQFDLTVSGPGGGTPNLGTYLGAYAHLTGFETGSGAFIHAHPLGAPTPGDAGSVISFHTAIDLPGTYRFFVQVRVDGFVHTVPVTTTVA